MSSQQKKGTISVLGAILMNVNLMIGAAAFVGPALMAQRAGSASVFGWVWSIAIFFPVVWCVAQIAQLLPGKGSFYLYSREGINTSAGFISGWVYFLGYVSIGAMQLMSLNEMLIKNYWPSLNNYLIPANAVFLGVLLLISFLSVGLIDRIQSSATLFKITPLFIVLGTIFFIFNPQHLPAVRELALPTVFSTIPLAIFGFWGFEGVCSVSHLIEGDKRNAGRAVMLGFLFAASIYMLFHIGLISVMGAENLALEGVDKFICYLGIDSQVILLLLSAVISSAIIVAYINAIFGGLIANSSMFFAMAQDKLLFASDFFSTTTSNKRPFGAALTHAMGVLFFVTIAASKTGKEILAAMGNLGVLTAFLLTVISLFMLQMKQKNWAGQAMSILAIISCTILGYYSWMLLGNNSLERVLAAGPFILILLAGYLMYASTRKKQQKHTL